MQTVDQMYGEMEQILDDIVAGWRERGRHNYGDAFLELGSRGQFSDIWRKVKKLKRSVWDGIELVGEQPEQIFAEIIPHCLMAIYCLRHQPWQPYLVDSSIKSAAIAVAYEDIPEGSSVEIDFLTGKIRVAR